MPATGSRVARTEFGPSLVVAPRLAAYDDTPIAQLRQYIEAPGGVTANGPGELITAGGDQTPLRNSSTRPLASMRLKRAWKRLSTRLPARLLIQAEASLALAKRMVRAMPSP